MTDKKQPQQKKYFDVKVETLVPATITYRVFAENETEALKQIDKTNPTGFKPRLAQKKLLKAAVYDAGSLMIKLTKVFTQ